MEKCILLVAAVIALSACKKAELVTPGNLYGKWELRRKAGSIAGFDSTFKAGIGRMLQFKTDSTYVQYSKNKMISQGVFHIRPSDNPAPGSKAIFFDNSSYENYFFLSGTNLRIGININDGVETDYVKISDH
jgi:hypothetical protein